MYSPPLTFGSQSLTTVGGGRELHAGNIAPVRSHSIVVIIVIAPAPIPVAAIAVPIRAVIAIGPDADSVHRIAKAVGGVAESVRSISVGPVSKRIGRIAVAVAVR